MKQLTGKCHCGLNTFTISEESEFQFVCYCKDCRVLNSGGHLCGMVFNENNLIEAKNTQTYSYQGGSGKPIIMHFCPKCATHLYAYPSVYQGKVIIRANTLVDSNYQPQHSIFSESAYTWDKPAIELADEQ